MKTEKHHIKQSKTKTTTKKQKQTSKQTNQK